MNIPPREILFHAPGRSFVAPYVRRAIAGADLREMGSETAPEIAVMLSSADIYAPGEILSASEQAPTVPGRWAVDEERFAEAATRCGAPAVILRCPHVVGTGMTGFPRELASMVWRGTFFHFPDNDTRMSVVHADDIAAVIAGFLAGKPQQALSVYNITDGENPTLHDFVEALAFRMKNKRVSTLSTKPQQWIGRVIYGKQRFGRFTTERTFSCAALVRDTGFAPRPVCGYLRTHVYDDNSL